MAQGRSTETISMIKWIRISRLSIKSSLSAGSEAQGDVHRGRDRVREELNGAPPKPETKIKALIPTPLVISPKPYTLNHTPQTQNPKP